MFIYILGMAPEPGLALPWSVHCLLSYCPELRYYSWPILLCFSSLLSCGSGGVDDFRCSSGGSVIASECVLELDSLDSRVPRATPSWVEVDESDEADHRR